MSFKSLLAVELFVAEHMSQRRPSASRQSSQGQPHHTIVKDDEGKRPAGKDPPPPLHLAGRQTRLQRVLPIQCPTTALRRIRHTHKRRIPAETPTTACLFAQFCHVSSSQRNFAFSRITAKRCCSDSFPNEPCPCQIRNLHHRCQCCQTQTNHDLQLEKTISLNLQRLLVMWAKKASSTSMVTFSGREDRLSTVAA